MQARDLKSIIESENHELKTQFCNVPFTITPDRNIYNIIRNKYKELALEAQTKFAEINEQFEDLDDLINNAPSAFVYCIEKALLELIQKRSRSLTKSMKRYLPILTMPNMQEN